MKPIYLRPFGNYHMIKCPNCGLEARIDNDQLHGKVSIDCPECDYHETHNIAKDMPEQRTNCPMCSKESVILKTALTEGKQYRYWVYECMDCSFSYTTTESDKISLRLLKEQK